MKLFKIMFLFIAIISIFVIYQLTYNNKVDYLIIGDSLALGKTPYTNYNYGYKEGVITHLTRQNQLNSSEDRFVDEYNTIAELTEDIVNNIRLSDNTNIKREIREADLITISIGNQELSKILNPFIVEENGLNYSQEKPNLDIIIKNLEQLFTEIKRYAAGNVYFVGYYNLFPEATKGYEKEVNYIFAYLNKKVEELCQNNNISYVEMYNIFEDNPNYLPNPYSYFPSTEGYQEISDQITNKFL